MPKLTISASESSSLPILEYAFNALAENPSRKSKTAAIKIKYAARDKLFLPSKERMMAIAPESKFREVIRLGMLLVRILSFNIGNIFMFVNYCYLIGNINS